MPPIYFLEYREALAHRMISEGMRAGRVDLEALSVLLLGTTSRSVVRKNPLDPGGERSRNDRRCILSVGGERLFGTCGQGMCWGWTVS